MLFAPRHNLFGVGGYILIECITKLLVCPHHRLFECFVITQRLDVLLGKLCFEPFGSFDGNLVVPKRLIVKHLAGDTVVTRSCYFSHLAIDIHDLCDMLWSQLAVFIAQIFTQLRIQTIGIYQLYFSFTVRGFVVAEYPDVGGNAGVVEEIVG